MGCHSSTIKFRDVYEKLENILNVDQQTRSKINSQESASERSKIFNAINQCPVCSNERAKTHRASNSHVFTDGSREVTFTSLLRFTESTWKLPKLHALINYLCIRAAELIRAFRRDNYTYTPCTLARWNFRPWLVFLCVFFHTLAVFQEMRAIPKPVSRWLQRINDKTSIINWAHVYENIDEFSCLLDRKFLSRTYSFTVNHKILNSILLCELQHQIPFSTWDCDTLGGSIDLTATNVVSAVGNFFKSSLDLCSIPQAACIIPAKGIPFIALIEWITLRHVLSLCGPEEDFHIYSIGAAETEQLDSPDSKTSIEITEDLATWRLLLQRFYCVAAHLSDVHTSSIPNSEILALREEKEYLFNKFSSLFQRIAFGLPSLSPMAICDGCFKVFALIDIFPNRSIHDQMSRCAFRAALCVFDNDIDNYCIDSCACFCRYLEAYICIYDLYRAAIEVQNRSVGCEVLPMNFTDFVDVIKCAQKGQDSIFLLASSLSEFDAKDLFCLLSRAENSTEHSTQVGFLELCIFMTKQRFGSFQPLEELRYTLGIGEHDFDKCVGIVNQILLQAESYCNDAGPDFEYCLKTTVSLPLYLYSARTAVFHALDFTVFGEMHHYVNIISKEERFLKWKRLLKQNLQNKKMSTARLMTYALYASTVLIRCLERAKEKHSDVDVSLRFVVKDADRIEQICLHEGVKACAEILELSVEELTRDATAIVIARKRRLSNKLHFEAQDEESLLTIATDRTVEAQTSRGSVMSSHELFLQRDAMGLSDLMYVCLFNYIRHHFFLELSLQDFFLYPFRSCWDRSLQLLLRSFPFDSETELYRQFYKFSGIHQFVNFEDARDANRFVDSLYEYYSTFFQRLPISKEDFVSWCLAGPSVIFPDGNNTIISAKDFKSFLRFLSGCIIARVSYSAQEKLSYDEGQHVSGLQNFINYLLRLDGDGCEVQLGELGVTRGETVDINAVLTNSESKSEGHNPDSVYLEGIILWYAKRLVLTLEAPSASRYLSIASLLPYSSSAEHEEARLGIVQKLSTVIMSHDSYLPISLLACLLADDYQLNQLEFPQGPMVDNCVENFATWIIECGNVINSLAGETNDSSKAELHTENLRFLLQYIHHSLVISYACKEVKKEIDASNFMKHQNGQLDLIEKNVYIGDFFQHTFTELLIKLGASQSCTEKLQERLVSNNSPSVDVAYVAHLTASTLVADTYTNYKNSKQQVGETDKVVNSFTGELSPCKIENPLHVEQSNYWRCLRDLLPFGVSMQQRARQAELFVQLDQQQKGYLSITDLYRGFSDVLHFQDYCHNPKTILLRAFFAAVEVSMVEQNIVNTNLNQEHCITPYEFCAFLYYTYRYVELYFMFDVLTYIGGTINSVTVDTEANTGGSNNILGSSKTVDHKKSIVAKVGFESSDSMHESIAQKVEAIMLLSTVSPFDITQKAISMPKKIFHTEFVMSWALLQCWGLKSKNLDEVFQKIDRHSSARGFTYFTPFAIWASKIGLSPDRHGDGLEMDKRTVLIDSL